MKHYSILEFLNKFSMFSLLRAVLITVSM